MKLSLFKAAFLVTVVLTTTALAQEQGMTFNFFGGGARSEGMGQAYLSISNDASAGGWNPAGLNIHEKTLMGFSYGFLMPRGEYTYYGSNNISNTYNHAGDFGALNNWSIITPIRIKNHHFVVNVSYSRNFDVYYKFAEKLVFFTDSLGLKDSLPNSSFERQGGINNVNFSLGTRLYNNLSFGLAANIYLGKVATSEIRSFRDVRKDNFGVIDQYIDAEIQVLDTTSYSGFNTVFGFLYSDEQFRGGLTIRMPFNLNSESDTSTSKITTVNNVIIADYTDTIYVDNMTSKIEMPLMIGLGGGLNVTPDLLLALDLEIKNFSGKVVKNLDSIVYTGGGERLEYYHDTDPNWSNVFQYRLGMEYLLHTGLGIVPLRAGYRNEAYPFGNISDYEIIYEGPKGEVTNDLTRASYKFNYDTEKVTGRSISLGTGIHWSQIYLDVAYTYTTYEQKIYNDEIVEDVEVKVLRSENKWNNHHLNLSFTGYF